MFFVFSEGFFEKCIMNNYFGIGIDAKISLDFHHKREEHPEKCRSRTRNYMWYGVLGSKQWLQVCSYMFMFKCEKFFFFQVNLNQFYVIGEHFNLPYVELYLFSFSGYRYST